MFYVIALEYIILGKGSLHLPDLRYLLQVLQTGDPILLKVLGELGVGMSILLE